MCLVGTIAAINSLSQLVKEHNGLAHYLLRGKPLQRGPDLRRGEDSVQDWLKLASLHRVLHVVQALGDLTWPDIIQRLGHLLHHL